MNKRRRKKLAKHLIAKRFMEIRDSPLSIHERGLQIYYRAVMFGPSTIPSSL